MRVTKEGRTNLYNPLISKEEYQHQESRRVLEKLYGNSLKDFVASLYRGEGFDRGNCRRWKIF